jgi:hypothetical protein
MVVHPAQSLVGLQGTDGRQGHHLFQKLVQFFLAGWGHQEVPEGAKVAPLVGLGDGIVLTHDLLQQRPLAPFPQRDALAHPPVQGAKVLLHLAKVGEQVPGQLLELQETVLHRHLVQQRHITTLNARNFSVDLGATPVELGEAGIGVGFAALAHLAQQRKQRH